MYNYFHKRLELQRYNAVCCRQIKRKMDEVEKRLYSGKHKVPDLNRQQDKELFDDYKKVAALHSSTINAIRIELLPKFREIAEEKVGIYDLCPVRAVDLGRGTLAVAST